MENDSQSTAIRIIAFQQCIFSHCTIFLNQMKLTFFSANIRKFVKFIRPAALKPRVD